MLPWGMFVAAVLLGWAAVTGRSPAEVTKAVLTGQPLPASKSLTPSPVPQSGFDAGAGAGGGGGGGGGTSWFTAAPGGSSQAQLDAVVNVARQQIGDDYGWGKEGPNVFDCSGLTWYSYKNGAGVNLPRTAAEQALTSRRTTAPRNGDLVFLGTPAYHCGIYSVGGYINAPQRGEKVKVSRIPGNAYFGRVL